MTLICDGVMRKASMHFYLGHPDYFEDLHQEILRTPSLQILQKWGHGFLCEGPFIELVFAQSTWKNCQIQSFTSIREAQEILKSQGKNWSGYHVEHSRRMTLIEERLHRCSPPPLSFPSAYKLSAPQHWTLLESQKLLFSSETDTLFPLGYWQFQENKIAPSRAFLKLWEVFSRIQKFPQKTDICLDMGSCPGGWTYVLEPLAQKTISVDRSPLVDSLKNSPKVENKLMDAFKLDPLSIPKLDWFFSDLICYPQKLLELIEKWMAVHPNCQFVCTIKFQGATDFEVLEKFKKISGSRTFHLFVNKHEVTWIKVH